MYERFRQLLVQNNITAYRVGKETGIAGAVFSEWKRGKSKPKVDKLKKLADFFGVTIEYFIEEDNQESQTNPKQQIEN